MSPLMRRKPLLVVFVVLFGCSDGAGERPSEHADLDAQLLNDGASVGENSDPDASVGHDADWLDASLSDAEAPLRVTVLRESTLDSGVVYQLLRLQKGTGPASYAQWFPPPDGGVRPVVVATKPYDGIDWTGEEVDARWAQQGEGLHLDVDGPGPLDASLPRSSISYTPLPPDKSEEHFLYSLHNFGTLLLYGRFYAGGDVQNDIDDMTLGFDFLAQAEHVDKKRVGIFGGSWGGFEALYGAAYARDDVKPAVGVGLSPLSDFEREEQFVTVEMPAKYSFDSSDQACATFFEPYLRRMRATTEQRGGFTGLRAQDLVARIKAPFLLLHDDWDTLVSFDQSSKLVELAPEVFKPLWFLHTGPPLLWDTQLNGHGPLLQELYLGSYAFLTSFLLRHLGDPDQPLYVAWDTNSVRRIFQTMHTLQRAGKDVRFFAKRLVELTDARIVAFDFAAGTQLKGAEAVARELNLEWNTSFSEANVAAGLAAGLPAP